MKYAVDNNKTQVTILTDSKSSCDSLLNANAQHKVKFLEQKILNFAVKNHQISFTIQWIPAHVGTMQMLR